MFPPKKSRQKKTENQFISGSEIALKIFELSFASVSFNPQIIKEKRSILERFRGYFNKASVLDHIIGAL